LKSNDFIILKLKINKGLAGLLGIVGFSAYNFKNRKSTTSVSLYLIQTRVIAQSAVVLCLTAGLVHRMYFKIQDKYMHHGDNHHHDSDHHHNDHHHHDINQHQHQHKHPKQ
jgi:ABC-type nickel/cobalt efflux system permease component RcnA